MSAKAVSGEGCSRVANQRGDSPGSPPPRGAPSSGRGVAPRGGEPRAAAPSARTNPKKAEPDPYLGQLVDGRFELLAAIGRGGMGQVYRARQSPLGRMVALKVMAQNQKPERAEEFQRRFFLEASTSAKLSHPNTITIFDYGSDEVLGETVFFIAMELIEGITLSRALRQGPFAPERAVNIALQMCRSLREAHKMQVVHRDLKPGNVMLTRPDGEEKGVDSDFVKVLDFGLAKSFTDDAEGLTRAGTFLGSPRYVAPEQIEGKLVDPRADIYAFGVVIFRMLSGRVPFDGTQPVEIMMKHLHDDVPRLPEKNAHGPIPRALADLVYDCLRKKPTQRPQSMGEVITRLKLARAAINGQHGALNSLSDELSEGVHVAPGPREDSSDHPATAAPPADISDPSGKAIESAEILSERLVTEEPVRAAAADALTDVKRPAPALASPGVESAPTPQAMARPTTSPSIVRNSLENEILDNTRPTHVLGRTIEPARRPKKRFFAAGLVLGALVAGIAIVAVGLQAWVPKSQAPAGATVDVQVRVTSEPPAQVYWVKGNAKESLGISPMNLKWKMSPTEGTRTLRFERDGHRPAVARVNAPAPEAKSPVVLEVSAKLRPLPTP